MTEPDNRVEKRSSRLGAWLLKTYTITATSLAALSLVDVELLWPLELFDSGSHVLLAPAPLVALIALKQKRWRTLGALAFTSLCWLAICGAWLGGSKAPPPRGEDEVLTVLTWNLGLGLCV